MNTEQILWGLLTFLILIIGFFIRWWVTDVKSDFQEIRSDLRSKVSADVCKEKNNTMQLKIDNLQHHQHTNEGDLFIK